MGQAVPTGAVVVGVRAGQVRDVVTVAAQIAERFTVPLVCVTVDPALLSAGNRADGSEIIEPIDPDSADAGPADLPETDRAVIEQIAAARSVHASVLAKVGDPARALAAVAEERDAVMIVVGAQTGRRRITEFFNGSVAARLAHQQHRPVLVVPVNPVGFDEPLPWDAS
ncbi:universal stress protein [Curtobacterium sp. 'Ferrero']|uniref:universal stress protein n=1 Tax=unclassified Curtobacterium TaxID=257496 RepID=UPI000BCEAA7E|nr:universal stress protein [Curtobacterium sp. 'Ferrero']PCN49611.1 universal stress family protein [Curtobacterium sp. 'Ferrero']